MPTEPVVLVDKDIFAVLLKSVWEHGLISEPTYRAALNKLLCTFDASDLVGYAEGIKSKRSA